jgi:hypothetical protein
MTSNKRMQEVSTSTQLREIMYTGSKDMLVLSSTIALCYTTAVMIAAPVPEIMNTPSTPCMTPNNK